MSSNSQLSTQFPAKSVSSLSSSTTIPSQPSLPSSGNEPQRRGGGGTAGASVAARNILAGPRNGQSGRKNHKNHRKPNTPRYGEDHIDEVAMALPTGRKGTSITHLMNWNVAAPRNDTHRNDHHRNTRKAPTWGLGSGYHAADKARYINANYRFLVHPRGDYRAQAVDSDVHLSWDLVLQVLASEQTQRTSCPICLSTPVAPRMAKCGHIFCLPCLLRYIASTEETKHQGGPSEKKPRYKKCVICMDSVYISETRPVRFFTGKENPTPREGEDVVLRLVMRQQGSTLALPKDGADTLDRLEDIPWHFAAEVMDYARVMKGTEDYIEEQYTKEIEELEQMEKEDEVMFGEDGEWTRKAVAAVKTAREGIQGMGNPPREVAEPPKAKEKGIERPKIVFNDNDNVPIFYHVIHEASSGHSSSVGSRSQSISPSEHRSETLSEIDSQVGKHPVTSESSVPMTATHASQLRADVPSYAPTPHDASYFFYQSLLHYYLSPLDIRILRAAFGSYSSFPSTILPRVENVTTPHPIDDDLRKRAKYLAHLPAGCEVAFLDCDWTDVVPADILARFQTEIERRRRKKAEKEAKEERDRVRAEKDAETAHRLRRRGEGNGRGWDEEDWVALAEQESLQDTLPPPLERGEGTASAPPLGTSHPLQEGAFGALVEPGGPSLGRVLSSRTVWGTPLVLPQDASGVSCAPVRREETGGWRDWEREFLDDKALELLEGGGGLRGGWAPNAGKGGKKKFKKVTLMTNGGKRGA